MVRSLAAALLATWGTAAAAAGEELSIPSKSLLAASSLAVSAAPTKTTIEAPFTAARPRDVLPELMLREELAHRGAGAGAGCEASASDLCYDFREARIVYRKARAFMPEIPGLRAESISLRHDRVLLKYSFR